MVDPKVEHRPGCDGTCNDGLEGLTIPELITTLETRKAMLVWGCLLYPMVGKLRSLVN